MTAKLKIRISHGSFTAIGPGKADLLEAINDCGSISAAAKKMNMSYRRAWELVDAMNRCFQEPLVATSLGGAHGGGAQVTTFGFHILKCYRDLISKTLVAAEFELNEINARLVPLA
ncbi:MAG: winged helix-turn-helix domain-containing protein [Methylophilaceae bacterium]|uniref:winged helix-turn-helix domain-containing protein n=1 Tax=Methylovorus sp. MM2 TaxID=1848038 RepID=UPI0007E18406|nr:winged helix-turn-helix domain-containing protein [Methylovorus sp. MM2]OAM52298.1 ModE family transcriptional regulator [Methylovorus sp. MM2]